MGEKSKKEWIDELKKVIKNNRDSCNKSLLDVESLKKSCKTFKENREKALEEAGARTPWQEKEHVKRVLTETLNRVSDFDANVDANVDQDVKEKEVKQQKFLKRWALLLAYGYLKVDYNPKGEKKSDIEKIKDARDCEQPMSIAQIMGCGARVAIVAPKGEKLDERIINWLLSGNPPSNKHVWHNPNVSETNKTEGTQVVHTREFATHGFKDNKEIKIRNPLKARNKDGGHLGFDVAIGRYGTNDIHGRKIRMDGLSGHVYMHIDPENNNILIGIESAKAPDGLRSPSVEGQYGRHTHTGSPGLLTALGVMPWDQRFKERRLPKGKYNRLKIRLDSKDDQERIESILELNPDDFSNDIIKSLPCADEKEITEFEDKFKSAPVESEQSSSDSKSESVESVDEQIGQDDFSKRVGKLMYSLQDQDDQAFVLYFYSSEELWPLYQKAKNPNKVLKKDEAIQLLNPLISFCARDEDELEQIGKLKRLDEDQVGGEKGVSKQIEDLTEEGQKIKLKEIERYIKNKQLTLKNGHKLEFLKKRHKLEFLESYTKKRVEMVEMGSNIPEGSSLADLADREKKLAKEFLTIKIAGPSKVYYSYITDVMSKFNEKSLLSIIRGVYDLSNEKEIQDLLCNMIKINGMRSQEKDGGKFTRLVRKILTTLYNNLGKDNINFSKPRICELRDQLAVIYDTYEGKGSNLENVIEFYEENFYDYDTKEYDEEKHQCVFKAYTAYNRQQCNEEKKDSFSKRVGNFFSRIKEEDNQSDLAQQYFKGPLSNLYEKAIDDVKKKLSSDEAMQLLAPIINTIKINNPRLAINSLVINNIGANSAEEKEKIKAFIQIIEEELEENSNIYLPDLRLALKKNQARFRDQWESRMEYVISEKEGADLSYEFMYLYCGEGKKDMSLFRSLRLSLRMSSKLDDSVEYIKAGYGYQNQKIDIKELLEYAVQYWKKEEVSDLVNKYILPQRQSKDGSVIDSAINSLIKKYDVPDVPKSKMMGSRGSFFRRFFEQKKDSGKRRANQLASIIDHIIPDDESNLAGSFADAVENYNYGKFLRIVESGGFDIWNSTVKGSKPMEFLTKNSQFFSMGVLSKKNIKAMNKMLEFYDAKQKASSPDVEDGVFSSRRKSEKEVGLRTIELQKLKKPRRSIKNAAGSPLKRQDEMQL